MRSRHLLDVVPDHEDEDAFALEAIELNPVLLSKIGFLAEREFEPNEIETLDDFLEKVW